MINGLDLSLKWTEWQIKSMIEQYITENLTIELKVDPPGWTSVRVTAILNLNGRPINGATATIPLTT